jgi:hypothetical protein
MANVFLADLAAVFCVATGFCAADGAAAADLQIQDKGGARGGNATSRASAAGCRR